MDNSLSRGATDWREGRRLRAFELKQQGWSQQRIAEALGVSKGAVSQWMKRARDGGGVEALKRQPAPGARPRLSEQQRAKVPQLLERGAEAHGFRGELWTCERVANSDPQRVWGQLPPGSCESFAQGSEAELAETAAPGKPAG
jgi:transposase